MKIFIYIIMAWSCCALAAEPQKPTEPQKPEELMLRLGTTYSRDQGRELLERVSDVKGTPDIFELAANVNSVGAKVEFWMADDSCGSGGCQYLMFKKEKDDKLTLLAQFFGFYKILPTVHHGFNDLKVDAHLAEEKLNFELRYNGRFYEQQ